MTPKYRDEKSIYAFLLTVLFSIIHESHYIISINFYIYW